MASARKTAANHRRTERESTPRLEDLPALEKLPPLQRVCADPRVRLLFPWRAGFAVSRLRDELVWRRSASRRAAVIDDMRFLYKCTDRASHLPVIARRHFHENSRRVELDWHPSLGASIPVAGLDHLRGAHADAKGVLGHFLHHGPFGHIPSPLTHHGFEVWAPVADLYFEVPAPGLVGHKDRAHLRMLLENCNVVRATGSFSTIAGLLRRGEVVVIASDLPGSMPVRFLGREISLSSGTARLASDTGARVVCLTWHPRGGAQLPLLQIHPPLDPRDYPDPVSLQRAILAVHEPAVLAWPEAIDLPRLRWRLAGENDT